jgi:hypothetical protein
VIQAPSFTPRKEGTYLLQLTVNGTLIDRKIVGVRQLKSRERVPAAQETTEDGSRGWAGAAGNMLQRLDGLAADPGVFVGVAGAVGLLAGTVLKASGETVIKSTLPGQETVASYTQALATVTANVNGPLFVLLSGVDGNPAPASGALIRVRLLGPVFGATGVPVVGDPVFVSDAGSPSLAAGTVDRKIGKVIAIGGGLYDFWMDGTFESPGEFLFNAQDSTAVGADSTAGVVFVDANVGFPDWTVTIPRTGNYILWFQFEVVGAANVNSSFRISLDGGASFIDPGYQFFITTDHKQLTLPFRIPLTAGSHTFRVQWKTSGAAVLSSSGFVRVFTLTQ